MKIILMYRAVRNDRGLVKLFSIMRLTLIICVISTLSVTANTYAQKMKITLNLNNVTLEQAFEEIKKESEFSFWYSNDEVDTKQKVSISVKNENIHQVLSKLLNSKNLDYSIDNKHILVHKSNNNNVKNDNSVSIQQSGKKITGVIVDPKGEPVIGAVITIKGAKGGTVTDVDGSFTIEVPENATLIIKSIGFQNQEIVVGNQTSFNIQMVESTEVLSEVVVVGYGTQKKVNLTGAVSAISSDEIVKTKNENVQNMLTGKIPGVRVVQKSSEPGTFKNEFDIRGLGTPLIIIDGIPRDNISRLDPNEIESFSVLKDASAAVYGVKAANGVVLITTKKGKEGKVELNYSYNFGLQQPIGLPNSVSAVDQMTLYNEYLRSKDINAWDAVGWTDAEIEAYRNGSKKSSDWKSEVLRKAAPMQQHNLSISGSSSILSYFFNFGYLKQDGLWKSGDLNYDRYNVRANVDANITKNLKAELRTSAIMDTRNQPYGLDGQAWNVFKALWRMSSVVPIYANDNPEYLASSQVAMHPVAYTRSDISGNVKAQNRWYQSSLALVYDIPFVKGLQAKALYSYDYNTYIDKSYKKEYSTYTYDATSQIYTGKKATSSSLEKWSVENTQTMMQLSLNYNQKFGDHGISGLFLYEEGNRKRDNFGAFGDLLFEVDQLYAIDAASNKVKMDPGGLIDLSTRALVGRINYDYKSRYLFEFSFRNDVASKFMKGKRSGFFPGVSAGWRISEESFIKESEALSFIDNLKLRGSWGKMGDEAYNYFDYLTGYEYPNGGAILGGEYVKGAISKGMPNPDLTWLTATSYNIGFDASFWNRKLGVELDLFKRDLDGLFATRALTLPGTVGIGLPKENLNSNRSIGYELTLSHRNKISDWDYNISTIFSYTLTRDRYVERARDLSSWDNWRNNPTNRNQNIWWGYEDNGQFTSYNDIYNYGVLQGNGLNLPGDYKYIDWNEDGVIDSNDDHPIASKNLPFLNYSTSLGASYKGFDLNLLLQGAIGSYVSYSDMLNRAFNWDSREENTIDIYLDRWHPKDPNANYWDPRTEWVSGNRPAIGRDQGVGTAGVRNASYLRLKSAELGYTLPKTLISKIGVNSMRVYINSYNLLTFTSLKYLDPEHPGNEDFGYMYPLNKSYNIGFNITF